MFHPDLSRGECILNATGELKARRILSPRTTGAFFVSACAILLLSGCASSAYAPDPVLNAVVKSSYASPSPTDHSGSSYAAPAPTPESIAASAPATPESEARKSLLKRVAALNESQASQVLAGAGIPAESGISAKFTLAKNVNKADSATLKSIEAHMP